MSIVCGSQRRFSNFPYDFSEFDNFILTILDLLANRNDEVKRAFETNNFYFSGCYTQSYFIKRAFSRLIAEFDSRAMTRWLEIQYGFDKVPSSSQKSLWVTFENRRPPFKDFQRTLSFDLDSFSGTNFYLPLWLIYIDFLETQSSWVRHKIKLKSLLDIRERPPVKRKFACAFINNPNPVRLRAIQELSRIGEVDVFGRYSNRYIDRKIEKSRDYMFSVCFENDIYPGYVTEKPLEAWLGDTVPLYWGHDKAGYLNKSGMINLMDFDSLQNFCQYVTKVYADRELYDEIYSQPFLSRPFDVQNLLTFFESWILE